MIAILNNINWKKKVLSLIAHPVFIALVATIIILLILPPDFPKYKLTFIEGYRNENSKKQVIIWDDLDNDGVSDMIFSYNNEIGTAAFGVYIYPKGFVQQWDLNGQFEFTRTGYIQTGDYNNDGKKELYAFTISSDSIYLYVIKDPVSREPAPPGRFIIRTRLLNGKSDVYIVDPRMEDMDGDGYREIVFGISTGFSVAPRAIFKYNIKTDSLTRSIETGNFLGSIVLADINADGFKEIITGGYAPRNILDTVVAYHDSSNWGMVFDHNLQLLFPPPEFPGRTGSTYPVIFTPSRGPSVACLFWNPPKSSKNGLRIYRLTPEGKTGLMKEFTDMDPNGYSPVFSYFDEYHHDLFLILPSYAAGGYLLIDTTFHIIRRISVNSQTNGLKRMDIDLDGKTEVIVADNFNRKITVFRDDYSHPATIRSEMTVDGNTIFSLKKGFGPAPLLYFNSGGSECYLSYAKNPWYYAKFGVWFAVWLAIYLFTLLVQKLQRVQLEKKYATEKKITELQLKIVKNQMDPHFTLNAINSVKEAIGRQEKEAAAHLLSNFAGMYRSLLLSADTIQRTLAEELEFTRNYLELEKFRMQNRFDYTITTAPEVNLQWNVPKMIIQSQVENAVKHGLYHKPEGGILKINAFTVDQAFVLEIEDNGIGRVMAGTLKSDSTGKGLKIMDQFLDLYFKTTGVKAITEISDIFDENMQVTGTKVRTIIDVNRSPSP